MAFRRSAPVLATIAALVSLAGPTTVSTVQEAAATGDAGASASRGALAQAGARVRLRDVAAAASLQFVHQHSPTPEKHFIESAPGGLAVFDYNGDGRPDIFFTNGAQTPSLEKNSDKYANRLFRNDGQMRFTDVTEAAG